MQRTLEAGGDPPEVMQRLSKDEDKPMQAPLLYMVLHSRELSRPLYAAALRGGCVEGVLG